MTHYPPNLEEEGGIRKHYKQPYSTITYIVYRRGNQRPKRKKG